jgi:hypothetical protein
LGGARADTWFADHYEGLLAKPDETKDLKIGKPQQAY